MKKIFSGFFIFILVMNVITILMGFALISKDWSPRIVIMVACCLVNVAGAVAVLVKQHRLGVLAIGASYLGAGVFRILAGVHISAIIEGISVVPAMLLITWYTGNWDMLEIGKSIPEEAEDDKC